MIIIKILILLLVIIGLLCAFRKPNGKWFEGPENIIFLFFWLLKRLIFGVILVILAPFAVFKYNLFVRLRNNRENAFADIDVQLQRRHNSIAQLVTTVKGYTSHEKETINRVVNARSGAINAKDINEKIVAENELTSALAGLRISVEAYPDLKASANFINLQKEISDIEYNIAVERKGFNSATKDFNTAIEMFPANIIAEILGFKKEMMFDLGSSERKNREEYIHK